MGTEPISSLRIQNSYALPSWANDSNILVVIRILYTRYRIKHPIRPISASFTSIVTLTEYYSPPILTILPHKVSQNAHTGQKHTRANKSKRSFHPPPHVRGSNVCIVHRSNTVPTTLYVYISVCISPTDRIWARFPHIRKHHIQNRCCEAKPTAAEAVAFFLIELVNLKQWTVYKS